MTGPEPYGPKLAYCELVRKLKVSHLLAGALASSVLMADTRRRAAIC